DVVFCAGQREARGVAFFQAFLEVICCSLEVVEIAGSHFFSQSSARCAVSGQVPLCKLFANNLRVSSASESKGLRAPSTVNAMRKLELLIGLLAGCRAVPETMPREQPRIPIAIVTLDGVRAEDVIGVRELPHLLALSERGVALEGLRASGPRFVSMPGYREIFSGRPAAACTSNACGRMHERTLLDELSDVVVFASWERYEGAVARAPGAIAISTGRHGGVTRDRVRIDSATAAWMDRGARADAWP